MSKSFGNYPDPRETIEKYGADAIRFYLMGGTLMKGEDMTFSEAGIQESIKRVLLPLWNSYTFFATYANIDGWEPEVEKKEERKKNKDGIESVIPDK
jgi:isoleucyl-tRNA synthetase